MDRRLVNVRVASTVFGHMLAGHDMERIETDWPADAEIVNAFWDHNRAEAILTVHSATFELLPAGSVLPEWTPSITVTDFADEVMNFIRREGEPH